MRETLTYASEVLGGALDIVLGCTPRILRQWTPNILQVLQDFGTAPKIEERGQVLRGQALQVPGY